MAAKLLDHLLVLPYLAVRHGVDDIPTTVVNGRKACGGALPEAEFVRAVLEVAASPDIAAPA